jgi:hypothetical protein
MIEGTTEGLIEARFRALRYERQKVKGADFVGESNCACYQQARATNVSWLTNRIVSLR